VEEIHQTYTPPILALPPFSEPTIGQQQHCHKMIQEDNELQQKNGKKKRK
jgi:hypothetical protein